jgi:hypothetical protein
MGLDIQKEPAVVEYLRSIDHTGGFLVPREKVRGAWFKEFFIMRCHLDETAAVDAVEPYFS